MTKAFEADLPHTRKIDNLRDCRGFSPGQWIQEWAEDCGFGLVGLSAILDVGRRAFRLEGADLEAFVRSALLAMMRNGARPVAGGEATGTWEPQPQYGSAPEQIVDAVVAEWLAGDDAEVGRYWFATPDARHRSEAGDAPPPP